MIKVLLLAALIVVAFYYVRRFMTVPKAMPREEAARLLGVAPDAGADEIAAAHRRLIAKLHPDSGGSAELAAQVNRARDVMLKP